MKKKVTNEEVAKAIGTMANQLRTEMDFDMRVKQSQMWLAEDELVKSLNEKQLELYKDFYQKREAFYDIAKEMYERKF